MAINSILKNSTPRLVALISSSIIAISTLLVFILCKILFTGMPGWLIIFAATILIFAIGYIVVYSLVERFIYRKIKLIYKSISDTKLSTKDTPLKSSMKSVKLIEDAEVAVVVMGSTAGTAKEVVDKLREEGKPAGLLRMRVLRPLPLKEIVENLRDKKVIGVMDRAEGMSGFVGPLYTEIRSGLYDVPSHPPLYNYIYGLGGRDIKPEEIEEIFKELFDAAAGKEIPRVNYKGVRE